MVHEGQCKTCTCISQGVPALRGAICDWYRFMGLCMCMLSVPLKVGLLCNYVTKGNEGSGRAHDVVFSPKWYYTLDRFSCALKATVCARYQSGRKLHCCSTLSALSSRVVGGRHEMDTRSLHKCCDPFQANSQQNDTGCLLNKACCARATQF